MLSQPSAFVGKVVLYGCEQRPVRNRISKNLSYNE